MPHHSLFRAAARCWERAGRFDRAAERYAQAEAWADAGRCWAQAGRAVEAAEAYTRAGQPISEARQWLASPWPERARRPYRQALQMGPTSAAEVEALLGLGEIKLASERAFEVAAEDGHSAEALRSLSRIAAARGRPDWAARAWCQVIAQNPAAVQESLAAWEQAAPWNRSLGWRRQPAEASGWPSREFQDVRLDLIWEEEFDTMRYGNRALAWKADGKRFAAASSGTLILGDLTGRDVKYRSVDMNPNSVTFDPESDSVLVGCNGGEVVKVDASGAFEELEPLRFPEGIWAVSFSPRGNRLAVSGLTYPSSLLGPSQSILRVWSWDSQDSREMLRDEQTQEAEGMNPSCAWSSDGRILAWCPGPWSDSTVPNDLHLFSDAATRHVIAAHENGINGIAFSPDDRHLLTVSLDRTLALRDAYTGEAVALPWRNAQRLMTGVFHPAVALMAAGGMEDFEEAIEHPGRLYLLRFSQINPLQIEIIQESVIEKAVGSLAFSPDGEHLLMSTYDRLALFRVHLI